MPPPDRCDCPSLFCLSRFFFPLFSISPPGQKRQLRTLASSGRYRTSEVDGGESETCSRRASAAASERSTTGELAIFFLSFFFFWRE